jgi:tRNA(Ile2) C34 agmatinyltransferase TiaS
MTTFIGIDDTDTANSRGTGHLARIIAAELDLMYSISGVTRHQLLIDPRIPYTAKNSCAAILIDDIRVDIRKLAHWVKNIMETKFEKGSDPGLAITNSVPAEVINFGKKATEEILTQSHAIDLAAQHKIFLEGLGGSKDGIIGALAAIGLAADGNNGRYVKVGNIREISGMVSPGDLIAAGIHQVITRDDIMVTNGHVKAEKLRPSRRNGLPVLFVEKMDRVWVPLKLD